MTNAFKNYRVTASLKFPGCYNSGRTYEVIGNNKKDAIANAKFEARCDCDFSREDGPVIWKAEEI